MIVYTATNGSRWSIYYEALPIPDRSHDWGASCLALGLAPLYFNAPTRAALIDAIEKWCVDHCQCGAPIDGEDRTRCPACCANDDLEAYIERLSEPE